MVKVSIIMPAYNVEKYIDECMNSIIHQTLTEIEIICVDDGSTDNTGKILDRYAQADSRIKVIHKKNTGYGNSMNVGLDNATGEYIGIVETDDFADFNMFEELYATATKYHADVVKSNYYTYTTSPEPKSELLEVLKPFQHYNTIFCPMDFLDIYRVKPCIWTGLYQRAMLLENNIRFNETPGASYQDTSFAFKVWTSAKRVILSPDAFLHYRIDNQNSSVKSTAKIFCLCDEYKEMERFLHQWPEKERNVVKMLNYLRYESYRWNYERLSLEFKYCFLLQMRKELLEAKTAGNLDESLFQDFQLIKLNRILYDTENFFKEACKVELDGKESVQDFVQEYRRLKQKNNKILTLLKKIKKCLQRS